MAMLDRHRKTGGYLQLLMLLETSVAGKQEKFLSLIHGESPVWEHELKKRMLSFKRILNWNPETLLEIYARIPEKILATAVWSLDASSKEKVFSAISVGLRRRLDEEFTMNPPTESEIVSCQLKIVQEVRGMTLNGLFRMEKFDAELTIPENIEDSLNDAVGAVAGAWERKISAEKDLPTSPGSPGSNPATVMLIEEMKELRRKLLLATHEIQALKTENNALKDRLEQIRKIA